MSKRIRVSVVLVQDQVTHIQWALLGIVVRDSVVRSKEPPPADVLDRVRDRRIRPWRSNNPEQVLDTYRGAEVERVSPSSKHRRNSESQLAKSMDAVIHNRLDQTWSNN